MRKQENNLSDIIKSIPSPSKTRIQHKNDAIKKKEPIVLLFIIHYTFYSEVYASTHLTENKNCEMQYRLSCA